MSYDNPRIGLDDSAFSASLKLAEGNPGAVSVLSQIIHNAAKIDPDDAFGAFGTLLGLDTADIYGPDIWMLYKDVCGSDLTKMLATLRAVQLGISTEEVLKNQIRGGPRGTYADDMLKLVQKRLPAFGQP